MDDSRSRSAWGADRFTISLDTAPARRRSGSAIIGFVQPEAGSSMRELWYVKARNSKTGEEIQRLAGLPAGAIDSFSAAQAMRTYLVRVGRAKPDLAEWEIVEVHRADRRSGAA